MAYCAIIGVLPRCITELIVAFLKNTEQETKKENWAKYWRRKTMRQIRKVLEVQNTYERVNAFKNMDDFKYTIPPIPPIREIVSDINDDSIVSMKLKRARFFYTVLIFIDRNWSHHLR